MRKLLCILSIIALFPLAAVFLATGVVLFVVFKMLTWIVDFLLGAGIVLLITPFFIRGDGKSELQDLNDTLTDLKNKVQSENK